MDSIDPMYCGARTRGKGGGTCERVAGWGTSHRGVGRCRQHGGASPNAMLAGGAELARREALLMGHPVPVDPTEAILGCLRIAWGEVHYYSLRIDELRPDELMGPVVSLHRRPRKQEKGAEDPSFEVVETTEDAPQLNAWNRARDQAMDRVVKYSEVAVRCKIGERQIELAERLAGQLAPVVNGMLTELGVRDHPDAPQIVAKYLRMLEAGPVIEGSVAA